MLSCRDTTRQQSLRHGHNAGEEAGYYGDDDDDNDNADVVDSHDDNDNADVVDDDNEDGVDDDENNEDVDDDEPICLSANLDSPLSRCRPESRSRSGAEIIPFADLTQFADWSNIIIGKYQLKNIRNIIRLADLPQLC